MKVIFLILCLIEISVSKPNVLFIAVDDLGSRPDAYTPNIDSLMNQSVVFTRHYATSPECGPSRTSMLTSLKVENHRVEHFEQFRSLNPRTMTLPGVLRAGGYTTTGVGKVFDLWTFGGRSSSLNVKPDLCVPNSTKPCSFDQYYSYYDIHTNVQKTGNNLFTPTLSGTVIDDCIVNNAIWQLDTMQQKKPFAMFVGITKPHMPFACNATFYNMYKNTNFTSLFEGYDPNTYYKTISHPYFKYDNREPRHYTGFDPYDPEGFARGYYACISQSDSLIGKLIVKLDSTAFSDNTIVVVWGDHGFSVGEKGQFGKKNLYERDNKSPLIIRMPDKLPKTIDVPVSNLDIFPTIAEVLNVSFTNKIDGTSMVKLMQGTTVKHPVPVSTFKVYGPSNLVGVSQWFPNNTTMMIVGRSSTNRLKPNFSSVKFRKVYRANTNEMQIF